MTITELNTQFKNIATHLKDAGHKVGGHLLVAHDGHAVNKLKDRQGIWLVVVMPQKTYTGHPDSYEQHNTIMLFILEKDIVDQTDDKELQQYQRLEDVLDAIIDYIAEEQSNGCSPFENFDPSTVTVDPEYREFTEWNGWSMTLTF